MVELRSDFISHIHRAVPTQVRSHWIQDQQPRLVLDDRLPDPFITERKIFLIFSYENQLFHVTSGRQEPRNHRISGIILCCLIDNGHGFFRLFRKGQRLPLGKQCRNRQHHFTFSIARIPLKQRNLPTRDVRIPQPLNFL